MQDMKILTKIRVGFGCVLIMAAIIAIVGHVGLQYAETTFQTYRKLARQSNADGRVQANMLMTRIYSKNFVIDANQSNINGVQERAKQTLKLIRETQELAGNDISRQVLLKDLEESLQRYVTAFDNVTELQQRRDDLVTNNLDVYGPETEKALTAIMTGATKEGDANTAYQAGITLRSLLLGRLYANRFLIKNDDASYTRAIREFRDVEFNYFRLVASFNSSEENLNGTKEKKLATEAKSNVLSYLGTFDQAPQIQKLAIEIESNVISYLEAFDQVYQTINKRNMIIQYELDRIGPDVAKRIEDLKLAIKDEQDMLGPTAEKTLNDIVDITIVISILAILLGLIAAFIIGRGITRSLTNLTDSAVAMGEGNLEHPIDVSGSDEIGVLSKSLAAMRDSLQDKMLTLENEITKHHSTENKLEEMYQNLESLVAERTNELAAARDEAERVTRSKADFLATMSHEIRTPMSGVIGMVELLEKTKLSDDQYGMLKTVQSSANALLSIINDILDFSKIDAEKLQLEMTSMSIADIVENVSETLAPNAYKKGIQLDCFVDPSIPMMVLGDPVRLRQILFNLGGNAVKFTTEGSVQIIVDKLPSSRQDQAVLQFQVIDTGIGISKNAQESLFDAFTQAESSTNRRFGGTGLGLTISKRLVELMESRIDVTSELGKGTCFSMTITFPVVAEYQRSIDNHDLSRFRILLALSCPFLHKVLPIYLAKSGIHVTIQPEFELIESQVVSAFDTETPFDIVFIDNLTSKERIANLIRSIQSKTNSVNTSFVLQVDDSDDSESFDKNTVYTILRPIKYYKFIRMIVMATGLSISDSICDRPNLLTLNSATLMSVEDAEAAGQLVLLAEDDITNQKVTLHQLNHLGFTTLVVSDGEQALEALEKYSFAILLTDCHMPNLDGFELTKEVRAREQKKFEEHLPIIAITAGVLAGEIEQCIETGMDDFLSKPVEITKLNKILKKWMPTLEVSELETDNKGGVVE